MDQQEEGSISSKKQKASRTPPLKVSDYLNVVVHACNTTEEVEDHELEVILGYMRSCFKTKQKL